MFGKGGFEGEIRRTPNQSIRGASKSESKEQLVKRAQEERVGREARRRENSSALVIQAAVRGHLARGRHRGQVRARLVELQSAVQKQSQPPDLATLRQIGVLLLGCWGPTTDPSLLPWYTQLLVRQRQQLLAAVSEDSCWQHLLCRLLHLATTHLVTAPDTLAAPLRLLEIFTAHSNYPQHGQEIVSRVYRYLIGRSYFGHVRRLIELKVPPLIEETTRPPTPICGEILQMLLRPLEALGSLKDRALVTEMMRQLCREILCPDPSDQVRLFILPCLAESRKLQLGGLVDCLLQDDSLAVQRTPCLLYSFLLLSQSGLLGVEEGQEEYYLAVLSSLCSVIPALPEEDGEESDDEGEADMQMDTSHGEGADLVRCSIELLNQREFVTQLVSLMERAGAGRSRAPTFTGTAGAGRGSVSGSSAQAVRSLCSVCHRLLMNRPDAMHKHSLLYTLAFRRQFLHRLWSVVTTSQQASLMGCHPTPLIAVLSRGLKMTQEEREMIAPSLAVFSSLFGYLLVTINDTEFYSSIPEGRQGPASAAMPFSLAELVPQCLALRDVALGLVELAFPESRPAVRGQYREAVGGEEREDGGEAEVAVWSHLFRAVVGIVRQLHSRDTRRQFCPTNHWIQPRLSLPLDRPEGVSFRRSRIRAYRPFRGLRVFTREELESSGPPLSTKEVRLATVLKELPFTISFGQRVNVFQNLVQRDKQEHQGDRVNFLQPGGSIDLHVRRDYIYEDAYDKLSPDNEPNLRMKMRVQLVNVAGLDEAGIDGGGLFREFLNQLLKAAFDPNRGFFTLTRDQLLYPSHSSGHLTSDPSSHYFFIGRMLGKALYENMLVELPLASFFLSKLLGQTLLNVDIDHLDSLDPELYRNLLYLKTYEGDVQDLGLDFTVNVDEFGETRVELLKADGDNIPVTAENRIEYIHLVADFKLNKQIRAQCNAFRNGLADVIGLDWLRMFSSRELSYLIAGSDHDIGLDDLMAHTNYSGGYEASHPTIVAFWSVVAGLEEVQKRKLLKFVTSCSRPPLLGFKDLDPPFCIQNGGNEQERIPTASTCMNLLKLPDYKDKAVLKKKLLYAIESGAGFELS